MSDVYFFYLLQEIWDSTEFWENLHIHHRRIFGISLRRCVSPFNYLGPPEIIERALSRNGRKHFATLRKLGIQFHLVRVRGEVSKLKELARKHPKWNEPRFVLDRMASNSNIVPYRDLFAMQDQTQ
jgi:hypothetical protein